MANDPATRRIAMSSQTLARLPIARLSDLLLQHKADEICRDSDALQHWPRIIATIVARMQCHDEDSRIAILRQKEVL